MGDERISVGVQQSVDLVTAGALGEEHGLALGGLGAVRRRLVRGELLVDPRLEVGGAQGDDLHAHVGVRQAAELGALAGVDPRVVGLETQRLDAPGHDVALAVDPRHPERVDDVAAGATHQHVGVLGDDELAAGDDR